MFFESSTRNVTTEMEPSKSSQHLVKIKGYKCGSTDRLVRENVRRDPDGAIRCAIAGPCSFVLPSMMRFTFARHFLLQHPRETEEKGFLEKSTRMVSEREDGSSSKISHSNLVSDFVVKTEQGYCCRIDVGSRCTFVQEGNISVSSFARHFRQAHQALARKHGFFKHFTKEPAERENNALKQQIQQLVTNPPPQPSPNAPRLDLYCRVRKHVAFHSGRAHCNITDQRCKYSQKIFKATIFRRHFCIKHPVQAMQHGFYEGFRRFAQPPSTEEDVPPRHDKRKKTRELVEENVLIDATGVHCRISETFCKYIQLSYSSENFMRHFRVVHPAEAIAKGMMYKQARSRRKRLEESDGSSESSENDKMEEVEPTLEESSVEVSPETGDAFDETTWLDAPSDDPSIYCRLCFSVTENLQQIFNSSEDTESSWTALIEECTGVRLTAKEDYRAAVCHDCSSKLHDIRRFRMLCETLSRVVRRNKDKLRSKTSPENEVEPPPLVSIVEPAAEHLLIKDDNEDDDDQEDVLQQLLDSDEDKAESVEDLPYIALQDDWFCCKQCNEINQKLDAMVDHLQNNHSELGFPIKPNPAAAQVIQKVQKVQGANTAEYRNLIINGVLYYKCNGCDTTKSRRLDMIRHWNSFHKGGEERPRLFCVVAGCVQNFMDRNGLMHHLQRQHSYNLPGELRPDYQVVVYDNETYYKCNDCDTLTRQKGNMDRHEKYYHSAGQEKPRLYCNVAGCDQTFMTNHGLNLHYKLHHDIVYNVP